MAEGSGRNVASELGGREFGLTETAFELSATV